MAPVLRVIIVQVEVLGPRSLARRPGGLAAAVAVAFGLPASLGRSMRTLEKQIRYSLSWQKNDVFNMYGKIWLALYEPEPEHTL